MRSAASTAQPTDRRGLLRNCRCVSLLGVSLLWLKSIFLGLAGEFPSPDLLLSSVVISEFLEVEGTIIQSGDQA